MGYYAEHGIEDITFLQEALNWRSYLKHGIGDLMLVVHVNVHDEPLVKPSTTDITAMPVFVPLHHVSETFGHTSPCV